MISINELLNLLRIRKVTVWGDEGEHAVSFLKFYLVSLENGEIYKVSSYSQSRLWHFNTFGMAIYIKVAITNKADCSNIEVLSQLYS